MKKFQTLYILILLLCAGFNGVYAQQQTTYEKKKAELLVQAWAKFGQDGLRGRTNIFDKSDKDVYKEAEAVEEAALLLGRYTIGMQFIKWYAIELKKIEKLKSAIDFQLENEKKTQELEAVYEKTDKGSITKNIKSEFEKWNQKGEFEKEGDYEERLKIQSQKTFSQICIEQIRNRIDNYHDDSDIKRELSTYDSESESCSVSFKINGVEWQNILKIPIADAPNFKNNWDRLKCKVNNYDWCFVENNLCPTLVTLYNSTIKNEFSLVLNNQSAIAYSFDNFEITNPYLKGYVFNYSTAKIIDQQILSAYYNRLDSIYKDFNLQLLQNPYNISRKIMTGYNKMKSEGNMEDNFNSCKANIKSEYDKLNYNFERELKSKNPSEYCKIYYSLNPKRKKDADNLYLDCRCDYPSRENFDMRFINGYITSCNCHEKYYSKEKEFFTSKAEFDSLYNQAIDLELELEIHKFQIFAAMNSSFQYKNLLKDYNSTFASMLGEPTVDQLIKALKRDPNPTYFSHRVTSMILSSKTEKYYEKIINVLVDTNDDLNKEWTKNGEFFKNKTEFFETYISDNYKQILKDKK